MILPGPEAQQLAIYIGWRLHGILGGIVAGSFFVIPSIFVLLVLSWLAAGYSDVPAISGLLYGIQPVVIAIVIEAVLRIGKRALHHHILVGFAILAFISIYFLHMSFPLVIGAAALGGIIMQRWFPSVLQLHSHNPDISSNTQAVNDEMVSTAYPSIARNLNLVCIFLILWIVPVGTVWFWRGGRDVLIQEALFFTKTAFITFGGAYAVLSYIANVAVNHYGWLEGSQMVHGLGLAESTPGPLIMVTQYVGFLGAWKFHGEFSPLLYGTIGALITTYVTFLPCFFFIFVGAPYIELLAGDRLLQAALAGVTSAVVGVITNLAVLFAGRVLFPAHGVFDGFALVVALISFILLQKQHIPIQLLVPVGAVVGMFWHFLRFD
jgi:chromate transporter